jgi:ribosomal protein S25
MGQTSLHESIKQWYSKPGDQLEVWVDGYLIDIVSGELLIEVQTGNFSSIKGKVRDLIRNHFVRVVHPVVVNKWIIRLDSNGEKVSQRKSPRKGRLEEIFLELVYIPNIWRSPNLSLEVLLIYAEELLIDDGKGSWRRKYWSVHDKRLLKIIDKKVFRRPTDFLGLLSENLPKNFTSNNIAETSGINLNIARKMAYTLRKMGLIEDIGKRGRATLYTISKNIDKP